MVLVEFFALVPKSAVDSEIIPGLRKFFREGWRPKPAAVAAKSKSAVVFARV
jgi:hypothetical protein